MKPTIEEIAQAYKEYKAISKEMSLGSWERQVKAFNEGKGLHPQVLRRKNGEIFNEAREKFFGLMSLLISEEEPSKEKP